MRTKGQGSRSVRGNMPMAFIAVALLLAGTFFGIVYAKIENGSGNSDSANAEFTSVDDAVERAKLTIESELGEIISDISTANAGTLLDRVKTFGTKSEKMFEDRFPNTSGGVLTELIQENIRLGMENMKVSDGQLFGGATSASYLAATGKVVLKFTSESTSSTKTVDIRADATSALPLIAEASTRFELSAEGGNSPLTQMVEYQLKSLAANRVMNGYGMFASGGEFGTSSIITEKDVRSAVRNALNLLESMYFRDSPDKRMLHNGMVDLADLIVLKDGYLTVDLGALYSQSILQRLDEYAFQWMEYIGMDKILQYVDFVIDTVKNIVNFIRKILDKDATKRDATNYIKKQMSKIGYDEDQYRYFLNDRTLHIKIDDFTVMVDGKEIQMKGIEGDVKYPDVDLFDWDGWDGFLEKYRSKTNAFQDKIREILRTVALNACENCVLRVPVNSFDALSFSEEMERNIDAAVWNGMNVYTNHSSSIVRSCKIPDPVMCEMYNEIRENYQEIFEVDYFDDLTEKIFVTLEFMNGNCNNEEVARAVYQRSDMSGVKAEYDRLARERVEYLSIFTQAEKDGNISREMASTIGSFLRGLNLERFVKDTAMRLTKEAAELISIGAYSGPITLPGQSSFIMTDGVSKYTETMTVTDSVNLNVNVIDPIHYGKNTHYIGFFEDRTARYSSAFGVSMHGNVQYTVKATNPIYQSLGVSDSSYSGTIKIDCDMDIPCISGWALAGVYYSKSDSILNAIQDGLKMFVTKLIEKLYGPIEYLMAGFEKLINISSTAMVEFGNFMNEMVTKYYEIISVPLEYLQNLMNDLIQKCLGTLGLEDISIMLGSQKFVFNVFGMKVTIETNVRSLEKSAKEYVKVTAEKELGSGCSLSCSLAFKENSKTGKYIIVTGGARGEEWEFGLTLDPMMGVGDTYASVNGYVRDVAFSGNIPELVQYQKIDFTTDDVPVLAEALSNIPIPAIGYKCSVEIGLYAKYNLPVETGVLINEVELNPAGDDSGKEWVEIYNNTEAAVDLLGYTLVPSNSDKKALSIGDVVVAPHQRCVIYFPEQSLNNNGSVKVALYDTYGNLVDRTPGLKDNANDDKTWQRNFDGAVDWSFCNGTEDGKNGGNNVGGFMLKAMLLEFAKDAAVEVLDEMGDHVQGTEQAMEFAERVLARITEKFIDCLAKSIVEACAFVKVELADYTESQHFGIKIMIGADSDLVSDILRYIASMIPVIGEHISCPEGLTAENILYQDIFLKTLVYTGISPPKFLKSVAEVTETDAAISVKFNLSSVATLLGENKGQWKAEAGIVLEDVPTALLPDCFKAEKYMKSDLWLIRMTFTPKTA